MHHHEEHDIDELMDPGTWDSTESQVHEAVESAEAIVPVKLSRMELAAVEQLALAHGISIPQALREAALNWIAHHPSPGESISLDEYRRKRSG